MLNVGIRKILFYGFCFLGFVFQTNAQEDSTIVLLPIEVKAKSIRKANLGQQATKWTRKDFSTKEGKNVAEFLAQQSGIFVKSYGLGSSATTSIRGASAGHTAIVWNGINLENPMLGQLDFSLIPISFIDELVLKPGGNSAAWGSGAIGGIVFLNNLEPREIGWQASVLGSVGSFGFHEQQAKVHFGSKKVHSVSRYFRQRAENNFPYYTLDGSLLKTQSHADIRQDAFEQSLYFKINDKQKLQAHFWWQEADRNLPPTTQQTKNESSQNDDFFRVNVHWEHQHDRQHTKAKLAFFNERQTYLDPFNGIEAKNNYWTGVAEIESNFWLNTNRHLSVGLNHRSIEASSVNYADEKRQHRTAIFGSYQHRIQKVAFQVDGRLAMVNKKRIPFTANLGIEYNAFRWLVAKANFGRNYRIPTLNDLHWSPGGNPDLEPEFGWSESISLEGKWKVKKQKINYNISLFNRNINNWILWYKTDASFLWSAGNLAKVWSRGIEQRFDYSTTLGSIHIGFSTGYDFILSTNQQAIETPTIVAGEQLVYVPKHQGFAGLNFSWNNFVFSYQHRYTGSVETLGLAQLKGYQLGNLTGRYHFKIKKNTTQIFINLENIWNTSYRVIENRAMPLRYFQVGFKTNFSHS